MASPLEPDDDNLLEEDYYAILNVSRDATREEINQAYKQQSKVYHPDKHPDPDKKKNAELFFTKLKRAQEVLADERTRVLYDLYGEKGVESSSDMEVVSRTKTPAEIIAEYERLQQVLDDQRLNQRTNPKTNVTMRINATDLFEPLDSQDNRWGIPVELSMMHASLSVSCPLTTRNTVSIDCNLISDNGRGSCAFGLIWKRLFNGWFFTASTAVRPGEWLPLAFGVHKTLFKNCTGQLDLGVDFSQGFRYDMIPINIGAGVTYAFDRHLKGTLYVGTKSLNTSISYETEKHDITFEIKLMMENSLLSAKYLRKMERGNAHVAVKAGPSMMYLEYGITKKITSFSRLGATVIIGIPMGVKLKLTLHRGNFVIVVPIILSYDILPASVTYATLMPMAVYMTVKKIIVDPFLSGQKEKDLQRKKQEQQEKIQQRRREAQAQVELMMHTVESCIEKEEARNGLVIARAVYGKLTAGEEDDLLSEECIDVTIPLQALVKDSRLLCYEKNTKSDLPGFYDPCIGEEKKLYIKYKFRKKIHHTTVGDKETLRLPQQRHLIQEEEMPQLKRVESENMD